MLSFFRDKSQPSRPESFEESRRERRREQKEAMPRMALDDRHVQGATILPSRQKMLTRLVSSGTVCEVGVARGDFSAEILRHNKPKKLHLIDAWDSERYEPDFKTVVSRFQVEIAKGMVEINRGKSLDVLQRYDNEYFDWVYLDTDHSYHTTSKELQICSSKVKPYGKIAGHDYTAGNVIKPVPYGVIEACHEFCINNDWKYEYITLDPDGHFSFCLTRM